MVINVYSTLCGFCMACTQRTVTPCPVHSCEDEHKPFASWLKACEKWPAARVSSLASSEVRRTTVLRYGYHFT